MPASNQAAVRTEIQQFEEKAAGTFAGFATEDSLDKSGLQRNLTAVGITAKVTATGDAVRIEVSIPEHPGLKSGEAAEDLTPAALTARAQAYLTARRQAVWNSVKSMVSNGTLKSERASDTLRALGYGDDAMPSVQTSVTASIARGRNAGHDEVSFSLKGEVKEADIRAKLEEATPFNPATQVVIAAFGGDAELGSGSSRVRDLRVSHKLTWPQYKAS
jgi:hypothetical protein